MAPDKTKTNEILDQLVNKYSKMVYRIGFEYFGNKYDAEDICQEVFLRYIKKLPVFSDSEHEKAWFIRVTINVCHKLWRIPWNRRRADEEIQESFQASSSVESIVNKSVLQDAIKLLTPKDRVLIYLFYYEEFPVEQIANYMNMSKNAAYIRLNRARTKLKDILKGDFEL